MDTPPFLSPDDARARFGELKHRGAHAEFTKPQGGVWRPEFGPGLVLKGYRLHPAPTMTARTVWRTRKR